MSDRFSLAGKNAVVTGGTRGIGLAIARGFVEAGAHVTLCGRKQENVDSAMHEFRGYQQNVQGVVAHVGERPSLERLMEAAQTRFGVVNVLVNNAGTNPYFGPIVESDEPAWDKTMGVNLKGPYMLSSLFAEKMTEESGGAIVNIASVAGLTAFANQGIYSVSKAGLIMLTKVMARELGPRGIRVNCICPGLIKTKLSEALWSDPKVEQSITKHKALGRIGSVEEIVGAAIYLASDAGSFTTGAVLTVDGGMAL